MRLMTMVILAGLCVIATFLLTGCTNSAGYAGWDTPGDERYWPCAPWEVIVEWKNDDRLYCARSDGLAMNTCSETIVTAEGATCVQ